MQFAFVFLLIHSRRKELHALSPSRHSILHSTLNITPAYSTAFINKHRFATPIQYRQSSLSHSSACIIIYCFFDWATLHFQEHRPLEPHLHSLALGTLVEDPFSLKKSLFVSTGIGWHFLFVYATGRGVFSLYGVWRLCRTFLYAFLARQRSYTWPRFTLKSR